MIEFNNGKKITINKLYISYSCEEQFLLFFISISNFISDQKGDPSFV